MAIEPDKGILIVFEGIDGAGKTTQAQLLRGALSEFDPILSKEPTSGKWGKLIKDSASNGRMPLAEELNAFIEDRKEHVRELISPSLRKGKIVILDRYFYSTIAYQGDRAGGIEKIQEKILENTPTPDMVFLLDIDPKLSVSRIRKRGDFPNSFEQTEALSRIRNIFNSLAKTDHRIFKLDSSRSIQEIHKTIISLFIENALKDKRCAKPWGCDGMYCTYRITNTCDWVKIRRSIIKKQDSSDTPALLP